MFLLQSLEGNSLGRRTKHQGSNWLGDPQHCARADSTRPNDKQPLPLTCQASGEVRCSEDERFIKKMRLFKAA